MVQVVKDPLGTKGARLTTDITIPSRYLVLTPRSNHVGVSQRIDDDKERERLKCQLREVVDEQIGFIVRTAAEGVGEEELVQDARFLKRLWDKIRERKKRLSKGGVLYQDLNLGARVLRDFVGSEVERIRVDSRLSYEHLREFLQEFIPELLGSLEYYEGERPIFDIFDIENEIQRALNRKVNLKSGGTL